MRDAELKLPNLEQLGESVRIVLTIVLLAVTYSVQASSVLVLGDSLSAAYRMQQEQGWVMLLQQRLKSEGYAFQVRNASVSGDTTQNGIARLGSVLKQADADIVIIELGANDGLRGTPPFAIKRNLRRLIQLAHDSGSDVLLLGMQLPPNYGPYATQFAALYPEVADDEDVVLVPEFIQQVALDEALMSDDGIHPNAEGQPYLLDKVWPYLQPLLDAQ